MIGLSNIEKTFGRTRALDGVSVTFREGRMTALLGPNGSGKTTALKALLGLVRPSRGQVQCGGEDVRDGRAFRAKLGYMPQIAALPENLTICEFLSMIADLRPTPPTRIGEMLARFDLDGMLRRPLKGLSGGTRQRVCAVMALMFDLPVYVFDEPTAGLDPLMARRFKEVVAREKTAGKTIVFTSHIMGDIEEMADHVVFLLEGRVLFDGTLAELHASTGGATAEEAIATLIASSQGKGATPAATGTNKIPGCDARETRASGRPGTVLPEVSA